MFPIWEHSHLFGAEYRNVVLWQSSLLACIITQQVAGLQAYLCLRRAASCLLFLLQEKGCSSEREKGIVNSSQRIPPRLFFFKGADPTPRKGAGEPKKGLFSKEFAGRRPKSDPPQGIVPACKALRTPSVG